MDEKRQFPRYYCRLKTRAEIVHRIKTENFVSEKKEKLKGWILDISRGGVFIVSDASASINRVITISFKTNNMTFDKKGIVVRTGLMNDNPVEVLDKFKNAKLKEKYYLAVQFDEAIQDIDEDDIR